MGDGRADSPGHSAKYGTYTLVDVKEGKVLHLEVGQLSLLTFIQAVEFVEAMKTYIFCVLFKLMPFAFVHVSE